MQVILLERVDKLGTIGDVVNVKPGFARNFLLPQGKALRATDANRRRFEIERETLEKLNAERRDAAQGEASKIDGEVFTMIRSGGETGQLYGSVASRDVVEAMSEAGFPVQRSQIALDKPIKAVGMHPIKIKLHPEVTIEVSINVARTPDEAERQARGEDVIASAADEDKAFAEAQAAELFEAGVEGEEGAEGYAEDAPEGDAADGEAAAREAEQ